jgi:hypothetical protein
MSGGGHVPQVRVPPHPSGMVPHWYPPGQVVPGTQPHAFGTPPPPHVCGGVHWPQFRTDPQPSPTTPQFAFRSAHVRGQQPPPPHTFGVPGPPQKPPPQVSGAVQFPQSAVRLFPQLSGAVADPQFLARRAQNAESDSGMQLQVPFTQVSGGVHVPHWTIGPHSLSMAPQVNPKEAHVGGTQLPQTFAVPAPPQVSGASQVPQSSVPWQPSEIVPQFAPTLPQVIGWQSATGWKHWHAGNAARAISIGNRVTLRTAFPSRVLRKAVIADLCQIAKLRTKRRLTDDNGGCIRWFPRPRGSQGQFPKFRTTLEMIRSVATTEPPASGALGPPSW